ncbi:MAG TPA: HAMP domain-containing sensor histidine kinase, partial [Pilimelia sp.]|nr:HAMP domain-containing sensor histidine kinase [Pilimelia sp.]
ALDEAARGLGELLAADHVVVRLTAPGYGWPPTATRWSRAGEESRTERLAALPVDWLLARQSRTYTCIDVRAAGPAIPAEERAALLALAAPAVLTIAYGETAGPTGAVTLARDGAGWAEHEVTAAEAVVAELCRGLLQAQLYERERDLVARLRDLDNAKSDFISTVSHELRTPLTSIAGYVEMLADGDAGHLTSAQGRLLAVIDRNTTRLRALIEDLLILSRIEAGTVRTNRQEVDFGALAGAAATAMSPTAAAAGVSVDVETTGRLTGQADPEQIDRLLMNLLSNAVKFTPGGGQVRVAVAGVDDEVVLRVSDTGMGIPEADRDKLFTKFFRASNATHHAVPGTGLGLAIVRTIVAHHGGHVDLDSAEGVGTTVTVTLPA